jgi:DNA repair exonuclease SbcCD ATPase subunit
LKTELSSERETYQQQLDSQDKLIKDIRQELEKAQEEIAQKGSDDSVTIREELEKKLREKDDALESEQQMRSSAEKEIEKLREDLRSLENQLLKVCQHCRDSETIGKLHQRVTYGRATNFLLGQC